MQRIRVLATSLALGGIALLSGCVAVPGDPYYSGGYSDPYYSDPSPVVVPAPVYIQGGGYYDGGRRYYDRRPYYGDRRPAYPYPGVRPTYPGVRPTYPTRPPAQIRPPAVSPAHPGVSPNYPSNAMRPPPGVPWRDAPALADKP